MEQITARTLRNVEWRPVYNYSSPSCKFTVYANDTLPGLTITKEERGAGRRHRTHTIYKFNGKRTDSPTQVVRYWNEHAKAGKGDKSRPGQPSGRSAADRVKPAGRT